MVAAHPMVADDEVLDRLVQDLAEVNGSGRKRRAVAEVEILALLPGRDGLLVDLRPVPEFLDLRLHFSWSVRLLRLLDHRSPAPGESGPTRLLHRLVERSAYLASDIKACGPRSIHAGPRMSRRAESVRDRGHLPNKLVARQLPDHEVRDIGPRNPEAPPGHALDGH